MKTLVIMGIGALLAACGSTPPEPLPPPPAINLYQCAAPVGMTSPERQPERPRGEYTQADVALYITDLHQYATRGWLKLARVREHADKCAKSADDDEEND
ncbi:hypothetical protein [Halomonas llamarensis]|uniref:Lipoprotein n=1 Tax=Halomonas llamarensis TaxID=2945104 RepID=A0ABT0SVZ7_9GAMM|nr:hypothetical protein [Halomonas llamarensis]MCL7931625.1 hypothetical protein [Halomonas llamarensis]